MAAANDAQSGVANLPQTGPQRPSAARQGDRRAPGRHLWHPRRQHLGAAFWQLWTATAISASGDGLLLVALPLLTITLTRNLVAIAGVTAVTGVSRAVASVPAGLFVDRWDRQRLMVGCNLVSAAALTALVADMTWARADLALVYVVAAVLQFSDATWDLATWAHSPDLVRPEVLSTVNGRLQGIDTAGEQLLGPAVGGALFGVARRLPFMGDAFSFVFSGWLCSRLPPPRRRADAVEAPDGARRAGPAAARVDGAAVDGAAVDAGPVDGGGLSEAPAAPRVPPGLEPFLRRPQHAKPGWASNLLEGLDLFRRMKTLHVLAVAVGWLTLCSSMVFAMMVLYGTRLLQLSSTGYGLFLAGAAFLGVLGSFWGGPLERRFGPGRIIVGGCTAAALSYLALAVTRSALLAVFVFGLQEIGVSVANVGLRTARQRMIPRQVFGRVVGTYRLITSSAIPVGSMLAAAVSSRWGIRTDMAVAGGLELASLPLVVPGLLRRLAREVALADGPPANGAASGGA